MNHLPWCYHGLQTAWSSSQDTQQVAWWHGEADAGISVWPPGAPQGTFGFQGHVWQVLWVLPCLGTASLGTLSTLLPGWNLQGCVSVSNFYPAPGEVSTNPDWLWETVLSLCVPTWWQYTLGNSTGKDTCSLTFHGLLVMISWEN